MTAPFTSYLKELQRNLAAGNATEHTHRPALKNLIESLAREITATNEPARIECGSPDYIVTKGELPLGYIEAKDVGKSLDDAEKSEQVQRYLSSLGNVILTDYLEFRWYVKGERRAVARLATLGKDGKLKRDQQGLENVRQLLTSFLEYQAEGVGTAKELAQRMARLAHLIRDIVVQAFEKDKTSEVLKELRKAFATVLIPDLDRPEKAAEFADMYAQTIAYGLFAARSSLPPGQAFSPQNAAYLIPKTNPFLRRLFYHIAGPDLDVQIDWLRNDLVQLLDRADMAEILKDFGRRARKEDPVVHFYETFLAAYDPRVREMRGVYYTPEPVVSYIVRSIDYLLKTRFQRPSGLADPQVLILDPALGTGTFLYSVVNEIEAALTEHGQRGAWNNYVAEKLLPRLFGFELLMAPYAVAHLKLGLLLQETGYKFQSDQRLGMYLTNTLEEAIKKSEILIAQLLAEEANAASEIKKEKPIMVVLGNPPYSGHSANRTWEIKEETKGNRIVRRKEKTFIGQLIDEYYFVDGQPLGERNPKWLQDDYVKFIRWGQWRIDRTGCGILGFITNHGYLDNPTFRGMRQQLMRAFSEIYLLNLHGNVKKKERVPDGGKDENVFDIQQGVAIAIFVKAPESTGWKPVPPARIHYADLWGLREGKNSALAEGEITTTQWAELHPTSPSYLFVPRQEELLTEYQTGWKVTDIFPVNGVGMTTARDDFVTDFDRNGLIERIWSFRNSSLADDELHGEFKINKKKGWSIRKAWETLQHLKKNDVDAYTIPVLYRPFDVRWICWHDAVVWRTVKKIMRHMLKENAALCVGRAGQVVGLNEWNIVFCSSVIEDFNLFYRGGNVNFPLYLYPDIEDPQGQIHSGEARRPNVNPDFIRALEGKLGLRFVQDGRGDLNKTFGPEDIFHYAYAVFHSPTYRTRYAEFLKTDFPRLPLTSDPALFAALAEKGAELVALHLMESPVLSSLITKFHVPGSNLVEKVDHVQSVAQASSLCTSTGKMPVPLGSGCTNRVYINKEQYFEGVPPEVWELHIGGYQACQKWLKDRKGRRLSYDDVTHYQKIVKALKETIRLIGEIDSLIPSWPII